jgi:CelD/BcsL family acetyltransferase involved in cellulose biosynthesis
MAPAAARSTSPLAPPPPAPVPSADPRPVDIVVLRSPLAPSDTGVKVALGADAWAALESRALLVEWEALERACPWSTPYQSSAFVLAWLRHYGGQFAPVVITQRNEEGALAGLLVLGAGLQGKRLVAAGAHQAEYQGWLATPETSAGFIVQALAAVDELLPGHDLTFKYTPPGLPFQALLDSAAFGARAGVVAHRRPLMRLDEAEIAESLRKKSNKSRWSRLQRLGPVAFERVADPDAFAAMFDEIIASYEARRHAVNGVLPFGQDPRKKPFHLDLMRASPGLLHVTVTTLSGRVIAAHLGIAGREAVHVAIVCHAEMHADQSPGKLHLLRLGQCLLREGKGVLDLTPGGDPWKERFANGHDEVHVLTVFRSAMARRLHFLRSRGRALLKRTAVAAGISPEEARRAVRDFKRRWIHAGMPAL